MALFEACCKEKIQQFEDAGSDEEDIWDEKDVTFAPEAQRRTRYCNPWNALLKAFFMRCVDSLRLSSYAGAQEVQIARRVQTLRRRMGSETRLILPMPPLMTEWRWTLGMVRIEMISCRIYRRLVFN